MANNSPFTITAFGSVKAADAFGTKKESNEPLQTSIPRFTLGSGFTVPADKSPESERGSPEVVSQGKKENKVLWGLKLLGSPWRAGTWTPAAKEELMERIKSYKPACDGVTEARVLLLGPVGAGKSSFISSVQSAFSGRVLNRAMVGSSTSSSFTKKLQSFTIRSSAEGSDCTSLVLCDTMGIGQGNATGLSIYDALCVIKGHVPEGHQFCAEEPVRSETVGFIRKPSLKDKIHCVVFVVDANKIHSYPHTLSSTFQQLREHISKLGVHQVALLTHVDEVCSETSRDVSNVYRSPNILQLMTKAGTLLGMATSYIVPVRNYSSQLELNENMDILLLGAVDHILQYVNLHFQDSAAENKAA
ncbi:interferon-induced protein 44-like [Trichomycterus rosablanca]|uniref:interferon-induced protein 44-like n=1 Tax=Trichomycterus rosablanca TaxID=2290929 RepID=UPI002F35003D